MNHVAQAVLPVASGLDVHKSFVVAVIKSTSNQGTVNTVKKRFSTFRADLEDLRDWLLQNDCHHVCMESTGKYWIPVYNVLESAMNEVRVCNPKWLSLVKGEKDDNSDCQQLQTGHGFLQCPGKIGIPYYQSNLIRRTIY